VDRPRLTIVIPTLNRSALVGRAVDSALAQTFPDLEILVSDNGSTDDTPRVLARYQNAPRVRLLRRDITIPATDHGTLLVDESRGELFLGLSDDDWLEPDFAAKVVALYDKHPDVAFVWTGCVMHYGGAAMPALVGPEIESGTAFLSAFLAGQRNPCWCACVTRTEDLRRIGPIPSDVICGDMFYWTKIAARGDVGCIGEALSHYVVYRDASDSHAGGSSVLAWAADTRRWVNDIVATIAAKSGGFAPRDVQRDAKTFLARSTANQFIWQALRGRRRASLLRSLGEARPFLRGAGLTAWMRVLAALAAPRWLLRGSMMAAARRRGQEAQARA